MKLRIILIATFLLCLGAPTAFAHSGGTDSLGGHYCWTNCESKGLTYGEYHFHEDSKSALGGIDVYFDTKALIENTKSDIESIVSRWGTDSVCEDNMIGDMMETSLKSLVDRTTMMSEFKKMDVYQYCEADYECSTNMKYLSDADLLLAGMVGWLAATSDSYCGTTYGDQIRAYFDQSTVKKSSSSSSVKSAKTTKVKAPKVKKSAVKSSVKRGTVTHCSKKPCKCPAGWKVKGNKQCIKQ